MKIVKIILIAVIALLSVAAGLAKVMKVPDEVAFLAGQGLSEMMILVFGAVQILGGVLTAIPQTRLFGTVVVLIGFLLSAVLVFLSGNLAFGLISLLPTLVSVWVIYLTVVNSK